MCHDIPGAHLPSNHRRPKKKQTLNLHPGELGGFLEAGLGVFWGLLIDSFPGSPRWQHDLLRLAPTEPPLQHKHRVTIRSWKSSESAMEPRWSSSQGAPQRPLRTTPRSDFLGEPCTGVCLSDGDPSERDQHLSGGLQCRACLVAFSSCSFSGWLLSCPPFQLLVTLLPILSSPLTLLTGLHFCE